jgi:hypothetical protein
VSQEFYVVLIHQAMRLSLAFTALNGFIFIQSLRELVSFSEFVVMYVTIVGACGMIIPINEMDNGMIERVVGANLLKGKYLKYETIQMLVGDYNLWSPCSVEEKRNVLLLLMCTIVAELNLLALSRFK